MAKRKAKRKYNRRKSNGDNQPAYLKIEKNPTEPIKVPSESSHNVVGLEPSRASEKSYIFMDQCKMPIRNLNDYQLNIQTMDIQNEMNKTRRRLELLENLNFQMTREQNFRGLK